MMERARASGELEATAKEGRARIAMREGRVIAIEAPAAAVPNLGRLIIHTGIAADAVERAADRASGRKIGDALVDTGVAPRFAVSHALRVQLRARARAIAAWQDLELRFERGNPDKGAEPTAVGDLMLGAMRDALSAVTASCVRQRLGEDALVMTSLGRSLVAGAPLWPDEQAVCTLLRHPVTISTLDAACRSSDRGMRLVLALRWLEAVAPPPVPNLSLLARKAREIRREHSAEELLDLPHGAPPAAARAAWRRLTASLHPDRFAHGSPELARLSNEVARALNGAAQQLRVAR
jgi:hypothetical protein